MTADALPTITDKLLDSWVMADNIEGEWCLELYPGKYEYSVAVSKSELFAGGDNGYVLKVNGDTILKGGEFTSEETDVIKYSYGNVMIIKKADPLLTGDLVLNLALGCRIHYIQVKVPVVMAFNFQPSPSGENSCMIPSGFVPDYGTGYTDNAGFGWIDGNEFDTASSKTLSSGLFTQRTGENASGNLVMDTFMHTDTSNDPFYWKVLLPEGYYRIWIGSDDPASNVYDTTITLFDGDGNTTPITILNNNITTNTCTTAYVWDETDGIEGNVMGWLGFKIEGGTAPGMINYIIIANNEYDTDGDGLSDSYESNKSGTDPNVADTDGDGISDYSEVTTRWIDPANPQQWIKLNPLDADCYDDGVPDGEDGMSDTDRDGYPDSLDPDSDGDNVYDGVELGINNNETLWPDDRRSVSGGYSIPGNIAFSGTNTVSPNFKEDQDPTSTTDPKRRDTDGDHYPDSSFGSYIGEDLNTDGKVDYGETDPTDPEDHPEGGFVDSDQDGLPNLIEEDIGTNIHDADTDDDGISDGEEYYTYKTDPMNPDSDYDGIPDGTEVGKVNKVFGPDGLEDGINNGSGGWTPNDGTYVNIAGIENQPETPQFIYKPYGSEDEFLRNNWIPDANTSTFTNPHRPDTDLDGKWESEEDINYNGKKDDGETDPSFGVSEIGESWINMDGKLVLDIYEDEFGNNYYRGIYGFFLGEENVSCYAFTIEPESFGYVEPSIINPSDAINGYVPITINTFNSCEGEFVLIYNKVNSRKSTKQNPSPTQVLGKTASYHDYSDFVESQSMIQAQKIRADCGDWARYLFWLYCRHNEGLGDIDYKLKKQKNPKYLEARGWKNVYLFCAKGFGHGYPGEHFIIPRQDAVPYVIQITGMGGTTQLYSCGTIPGSSLKPVQVKNAISGKFGDSGRTVHYDKIKPGDMFFLDYEGDFFGSPLKKDEAHGVNHVLVYSGPIASITDSFYVFSWGTYERTICSPNIADNTISLLDGTSYRLKQVNPIANELYRANISYLSPDIYMTAIWDYRNIKSLLYANLQGLMIMSSYDSSITDCGDVCRWPDVK